MFCAIRNAALGAAAVGLCAGVTVPAQAAYVVSLQQVGANVVATGGGTVNLSALSSTFSGALGAGISPSLASLRTGPVAGSTPISGYTGGITGPSNFGSNPVGTSASSGSGDIVGIFGNPTTLGVPGLVLPSGYVSGALLSDTSTYTGKTFASLGATPGTYVWNWGTGASADSFTLQIGPAAAAPEPASLPLLALGLAGLGMVLRTRRA